MKGLEFIGTYTDACFHLYRKVGRKGNVHVYLVPSTANLFPEILKEYEITKSLACYLISKVGRYEK